VGEREREREREREQRDRPVRERERQREREREGEKERIERKGEREGETCEWINVDKNISIPLVEQEVNNDVTGGTRQCDGS
jgi:hypothetical protein